MYRHRRARKSVPLKNDEVRPGDLSLPVPACHSLCPPFLLRDDSLSQSPICFVLVHVEPCLVFKY